MLRVNSSEYRRWIAKETFVEMLASGQQLEQLYIPQSQENFIQTLNYLKSKFCMARLFPNFSDTSMYTLLECRIWSGTEFTFTWPNLRVESLYPPSIQMDPTFCPLRKEDFCPCMLWVTLPRDYVSAMMRHTLETGWNFGMVGPEMAYMGEHFNSAFLQGQHFCYMLSISHVHHGVNTLHLVQYFNNFRNHPGLSMLMHIPMTRGQQSC